MTLVADRVKELSTTTGTGTLTLDGTFTGFQTFATAFGTGASVYYVIDGGAYWEIGIGTTGATTLTRDTVLQSSNGDALVPFGAGDKTVFCAYVADRAVMTSDAATLTNKTLDDYTNNIGANHTHFRIKANATLAKGDVVKAVGFTPGEQAIQVSKVASSTDVAIGICDQALATGAFGLATVIGELFGVDTHGFTLNDTLYSNGSGGYTITKPSSGLYQVLGSVVRANTNNGVIAVNIVSPTYVDASTNTANTLVLRDGSGNFSAATITANLTGNISGTAPAGTLTGTTLAATVVSSSLTSVGTLGGLTVTNPISGSVTGSSGSTTGNAATATALSSARTFAVTGDITGSVSSDLTSGASIATAIASGVIVDNDVNASAAIAYSKLALSNSIVNADIAAAAAIVDTKLATISTAGKVANTATTATNANTASAIVARDASGDFSAGSITAALTGNATTATTADKVANALTAGTYLTAAGTFDGAAARTFAVDATSANTASKVVARDASGNFSAGTITANLTGNVSGSSGSTTGNAATATALQTARTINGTSFNGTADITVTAAAGTLTGSTLASGVTASSLTSVGTLGSLAVSGVTTLSAGTAGAPGLTTTGDTNTGVFFPAADTVAVTTGGTERLRIDASGNLLLGTTTTSSPGGVYKSIDVLGQLVGQVVASANDSGIYGGPVTIAMSADTYSDLCVIGSVTNHPLLFSTNNTERARITTAGNLTFATDNAQDIGASGATRPRTVYIGTSAVINGITVGRGGGAMLNNTAVGSGALYSNTTGNYNTASGYQALYSNTTGTNNTASGLQALYFNTTGSQNTASGLGALLFNTTGYQNTANGYQALYSNTTGNYNTASGYQALYNNTTGINNTASGVQALYNNTTGTNNTASGLSALASNTTGNNNTASGMYALYNNTTGAANTASGYQALYNNTTGSENTASGLYVLRSNTTGNSNTASGYYALYSNTTGYQNTATGLQALYNNTTGINNTASGLNALVSNTTGNSNTAVGNGALQSNTTGANNTASGYAALSSNTTGSGNTAISPQTSGGSYSPVFDPTTQNNRFCMGSTAVTDAYIQVAWTVVSDARDKTNIASVPHGLAFVNALTPVAYQFRTARDSDDTNGRTRYGFLAQDVLALEGADSVIVDAEDDNKLRMVDTALIPVLVNAIKELTARLTALETAA